MNNLDKYGIKKKLIRNRKADITLNNMKQLVMWFGKNSYESVWCLEGGARADQCRVERVYEDTLCMRVHEAVRLAASGESFAQAVMRVIF